MSILDERDEYLKNPYFKEHLYGDFTAFYVTIALCTVLGVFLFVLNIVFCWCSRHREYWQDRNSGELDQFLQSVYKSTHHIVYAGARD